jgi:hypothetical protein
MVARVAGQALTALGYTLQSNPTHQARGLFRYSKTLEGGISAYVEFQVLHYQVGGPSRFRVNLLRNTGIDARAPSDYGEKIDTTLAKLVWDEFGVRQLAGPDHWWTFRDPNELGYAIAEAGKLLIGFGIPWLEGELSTDDLQDEESNGIGDGE